MPIITIETWPMEKEKKPELIKKLTEVFTSMGIPAEKIRLRQHNPKEKAFYADDAWDLEIRLNSFGWMECCGIHDRTDYDLKQHSEFSKTKMEASAENGNKFTPHVLEIAFGIDRPVFALLDIYKKQLTTDNA